jgi:hypothetical protein
MSFPSTDRWKMWLATSSGKAILSNHYCRQHKHRWSGSSCDQELIRSKSWSALDQDLLNNPSNSTSLATDQQGSKAMPRHAGCGIQSGLDTKITVRLISHRQEQVWDLLQPCRCIRSHSQICSWTFMLYTNGCSCLQKEEKRPIMLAIWTGASCFRNQNVGRGSRLRSNSQLSLFRLPITLPARRWYVQWTKHDLLYLQGWRDHCPGQVAEVLKGGLSDFKNRKYSFCNICPPFTWSKLHL